MAGSSAGALEIDEVDQKLCATQSDAANAEGLIEIGPGEVVTVAVLSCGPMPLQ